MGITIEIIDDGKTISVCGIEIELTEINLWRYVIPYIEMLNIDKDLIFFHSIHYNYKSIVQCLIERGYTVDPIYVSVCDSVCDSLGHTELSESLSVILSHQEI